MALGYEKVKIALEQDGELKYLNNIQFYKEGAETKVSYQLSQDAQVLINDGAVKALEVLRKNEPHNNFLALNGEE